MRSFIGTEILGTSALGNQAGGVLLAGTAYGNAIGEPRPHPANLISGNTGAGVTLLAHTRANWVISNYIGLGRFGHPLPNTGARCGTWAVITTSCATGCESSHPVTGHRGETAPSRLGNGKWVGNSPK